MTEPPLMRRPPRWARALLSLCVPRGWRGESVLGDLEEGYHERARSKGAFLAVAWYGCQAWRLGLRFLLERLVFRRLYTPWQPRRRFRNSLQDSIIQDVRFALRSFRRRPLYASVAVLTLGLGIGATTAMFSVVNGVLLKPLPYNEPDRLVAIWQTVPDLRDIPGDDGARWDRYRFTYSQYRDLSAQSTLYEGLAAYRAGTPDVVTLTGVGNPVELGAGAASASLLPLLGVQTVQGRWFLPGEEASRAGDGGASVAVISYTLWQGRFGGSRETVGRIVTLDDRPFTIVGILPPGFRVHWLSASVAGEGIPGKRDIWFPIGAPGWVAAEQGWSWEVMGRLSPDVTVEQALAETKGILSVHPQTVDGGEARVIPRPAEETRGLAPPLGLLLGATGFLLLIACGNIATLSMAEVLSRGHEIATRSALGAGATRIVRLLLTEAFVLAALGTAVGVALAFGGTRALVALAPPIQRLDQVGVDAGVLGFAVLIGACAALLSGTVPSLLASRTAAGSTLHSSARTSAGRRRFTSTVIAVEVAMTAMLLVTGGLLARSLSRLLAIDPGFDTSGLATVEVRLPRSRYETRESRAAFFRDALERLEAVPGIGTVTGVSRLPFPGYTSAMNMVVDGHYYSPLFYQVAPGYLETLGVPLLAGRSLAETDGPGAPLAVVINETAARRFWPGGSPVGARVTLSYPDGPVTVVGVVGDMKRQALYADTEPAFFIPFSRIPDWDICFVARTSTRPRDVLPLMRESVTSLDGELVVKNATTIAALVAQSASHERYRTLLTTFFGILAALLAAAGIFGVTARSVALRTREMGIRMALGAQRTGLVRTTVRSSLLTGLGGATVGMAGALWSSRLLARFLFGVGPSDPVTYGVVAALILAVCLLASFGPARRISGLSPGDVLRAE
jgi:putative ABC transport system permease protein